MSLIRALAAPLGVLVLLILVVIIGFSSNQTGLVGVALLCLWPALWAAGAWTIRGLRDNFQLVPRPQPTRQPRRGVGETVS
jgi:hypothetical protein